VGRTVLVVEDDDGIRLVLRTFLEEEGYRVLEAVTGEEALTIAQDEAADVVLVDLRLPGIHGLDVVRSLRATSHVPIIVVTAQTDSHDVVAGLEAGADDYVTKPFVAKELSARIRAQLRRTAAAEPDSAGSPAEPALVCGPLEIRPDTAEVLFHGEPVSLSRTEFRVLQELALARGRVLSRDDLLRRVWGYGNAGDGRVVDNLVYRLRSKVEDDPAEPEHLITVRGFGYRLKD
jgi:DNA-binding response OmpR family regulator